MKAFNTSDTIVTRAAQTTNCTMIRTLLGIVLRIRDTTTLAIATMIVTEIPITIAGFNCTVTAKAEQIPSTWIATGLFLLRGPSNAFFNSSFILVASFDYRFNNNTVSYFFYYDSSRGSEEIFVVYKT